jgi:hypothetical protein
VGYVMNLFRVELIPGSLMLSLMCDVAVCGIDYCWDFFGGGVYVGWQNK